MSTDLQARCELGQEQLMRTEYLEAEATLAAAEADAWAARDFDALSRLYMPLQEARRQRRQRCGEGVVCLDQWAEGPADVVAPAHVVQNFPHGQLLVAGWGSFAPALAVREQQAKHGLYVETFLGAVYPIGTGGGGPGRAGGTGRAVVIVPTPDVQLPDPDPQPVDSLRARLPAHCVVLAETEVPRGARRGTTETYAEVMALWERLHLPFLAAADADPDPVRRME